MYKPYLFLNNGEASRSPPPASLQVASHAYRWRPETSGHNPLLTKLRLMFGFPVFPALQQANTFKKKYQNFIKCLKYFSVLKNQQIDLIITDVSFTEAVLLGFHLYFLLTSDNFVRKYTNSLLSNSSI